MRQLIATGLMILVRITLIAGVLFGFSAFTAQAADVTPGIEIGGYNPPPAIYPDQPLYDWSGLYVGLEAGYSWGHINYDQIDPPVEGAEYGILGGVNWQSGRFVFGIQADVANSNEKGTNFFSYGDEHDNTFDVTTNAEFDWTAGLIGTAGVALGERGHILPYVGAGVGFAGGHANMTNIGSHGGSSWLADASEASFVAMGPRVAVGVQAAITEKVSVGVQVDRTWYNNVNIGHEWQMYDNQTSFDIEPETRVMGQLRFRF